MNILICLQVSNVSPLVLIFFKIVKSMRRGSKCFWPEFQDTSHNMFLHLCHRESKADLCIEEGGFGL